MLAKPLKRQKARVLLPSSCYSFLNHASDLLNYGSVLFNREEGFEATEYDLED